MPAPQLAPQAALFGRVPIGGGHARFARSAGLPVRDLLAIGVRGLLGELELGRRTSVSD
jgi:hypothetical protein